jgi:hypothetical protein
LSFVTIITTTTIIIIIPIASSKWF